MELAQSESLEGHYKTIEKQLDQIAKTDAQIQRVQTIKGVGRVTAEAIVNFIDDPTVSKTLASLEPTPGWFLANTNLATPIDEDESPNEAPDYCERCWSSVLGAR